MTRVERDDGSRGAILARWPQARIALPAQLLCGLNESAVFLQYGSAIGVLGPGRHALDPSVAPFLERIAPVGTESIPCEVWFVTTTPIAISLQGGSAPMSDPQTAMMFEVKLDGEAMVRVVEPQRFCTTCAAMAASSEAMLTWLRDRIITRVGEALGKAAETRGSVQWAVETARASGDQIAEELRPDLASLGLEVTFPSLQARLEDDDRQRLESMRSEPTPQATGQPAQPPQLQPAEQAPMQPAQHNAVLPLPLGARVSVCWTDGRWYAAVVRQFLDGHYLVTWEGSGQGAWIPATAVRPA